MLDGAGDHSHAGSCGMSRGLAADPLEVVMSSFAGSNLSVELDVAGARDKETSSAEGESGVTIGASKASARG